MRHRALDYAGQRTHEYATLEHLLLALIDDADARAVIKGSDVDLDSLRKNLAGYVDNELKEAAIDSGADPRPTDGFQRFVWRAVVHVQGLGHATVTGAGSRGHLCRAGEPRRLGPSAAGHVRTR
jgi:ATP-dependent Clp protease ATP-binding subunit ClpA